MGSLSSIGLTIGFEPTFNSMMKDVKTVSDQMGDKSHPAYGAHSFAATLGSTLLIVPVELFAAAENALKLPLVAASALFLELPLATVGYTARCLCFETFGQTLINMQKDVPGLLGLFYTAYKVFALVLGAFATLTLGMISTQLNYGLHSYLYLLDPSLAMTEVIERVNRELSAHKATIHSLEEKNKATASLEAQVKAKDAEIARLQAFETKLNNLQDQFDKLSEEKKALDEKLKVQPSAKNDEATAKITTLMDKLTIVDAERKKEEKETAQIIEALTKRTQELEDKVKSSPSAPQQLPVVSTFQEEKAQLEQALAKANAELKDLRTKLKSAREEAEAATQAAQQLMEENSTDFAPETDLGTQLAQLEKEHNEAMASEQRKYANSAEAFKDYLKALFMQLYSPTEAAKKEFVTQDIPEQVKLLKSGIIIDKSYLEDQDRKIERSTKSLAQKEAEFSALKLEHEGVNSKLERAMELLKSFEEVKKDLAQIQPLKARVAELENQLAAAYKFLQVASSNIATNDDDEDVDEDEDEEKKPAPAGPSAP